MVTLWLKEEELHVHGKEGAFLCKHTIAESKGNTVINTDYKQDKTLKLKELLTQTSVLFLNPALAMEYFEMIRKQRTVISETRYIISKKKLKERTNK